MSVGALAVLLVYALVGGRWGDLLGPPLAAATPTDSAAENPAVRSASATASPSGMSCSAIAVVSGSPTLMSPCEKLTPIAMPSGRL